MRVDANLVALRREEGGCGASPPASVMAGRACKAFREVPGLLLAAANLATDFSYHKLSEELALLQLSVPALPTMSVLNPPKFQSDAPPTLMLGRAQCTLRRPSPRWYVVEEG